jgi:hypothetical protein
MAKSGPRRLAFFDARRARAAGGLGRLGVSGTDASLAWHAGAWSGRQRYVEAVDPAPATAGSEYEPGVPSLRDLGPSLIFGAAVPLAVYYGVRHHVHSDAQALIIAGAFPVVWILVGFVRTRRIDPIGAIVLFGFVVGVVSSTLLGGNTYVLKARDSAFTIVFGLICLVSIVTHSRPAIFYIGRYLSAGNDPDKIAAYDELHELPTGQRTFRILTLVWGIGLLIEGSTRLVLAAPGVLSTGVFLAISPVISGVCIGAMFAFTVVYSNRSRARAAAILAEVDPAPAPIPSTEA